MERSHMLSSPDGKLHMKATAKRSLSKNASL